MSKWREIAEDLFELKLERGCLEIERRRWQSDQGDEWGIYFYPGFIKFPPAYGTADEAKAAAVAELRSWLTDMLGGLP